MIAIAAVLSVLLAVAIYAFVSFLRFPRMRLSELATYASQPNAIKPSYTLGFIFFAIWGVMLWALASTGHDLLVGAIWAGTIIAALFLAFRQSSIPPTCDKCGALMQTFRKVNERNERVVPAIFYLHVCKKCKVYREQLVIAVGGG